MFIVTPFGKDSSIRSALGFMSLTSRWGSLMFPGITVLTRDLHELQAIHSVIIEQKKKSGFDPKIIMHKSADELVEKKLIEIIGAEKMKGYKRQVMSFWQRYGSIVLYFDLFKSDFVPTVDRYRKIIFDNEIKFKTNEPNDKKQSPINRKVRIENATWYRDFVDGYISNVNLDDIDSTLKINEIHWWFTGMKKPRNLEVPEIITLSRKLEFALTVWQSTLEASSLLLKLKKKVPKAKKLDSDEAISIFLNSVISRRELDNEERLERIVYSGLSLHNQCFNDGSFEKWKKDFSIWINNNHKGDMSIRPQRYINLHKLNRSQLVDISSIASLRSSQLLEALTNLHVDYCHIQRKSHAIYIQNFETGELGNRLPPDLSANYGGGRWGLFGYRFGASFSLYHSDKYKNVSKV